MTTVATLDTRLNLDSTSFDTGLRRSRQNAQRFSQETSREIGKLEKASLGAGRALASIGAGFATVGAIGGIGIVAAGIAGLTSGLRAGLKNSEDYQKSLLRLEAVFKATGGTAGVTVRQVDQFAERLERTTLANSEAIKDAAASLATFKSISGDAFFRTIELGQDLAAVFGGDLRSSITQLGKALEEPITGLSALREKGVTFSATQKEQIRLFVEAGEAAKAQGLILDTLAEQVGGAGSSEASGLTGAFALLNTEIGDFLQLLAESSGAAGLLDGFLRENARMVNEFAAGLSIPDTSKRTAEIAAELREIAAAEKSLNESRNLRGPALTDADLRPLLERRAALEAERIEIAKTVRDRAKAARAAEDQAKAAADSAKASIAAEAAAAKATEAATKRNEEAKKAAEERAKAIEAVLGPLRVEADEAARLASVQGQGKAAVDALNQALEIEAALRSAGVDAASKQGKEIAKLIKLRDSETKAIEAQRKADERRAAVADEANRRRFDRGFDPTRAAEEFRAGQAADRRENAAQLSEPIIKNFISEISSGFVSIFRDLRTEGIRSFRDIAFSIANTFASIPEQTLGAIATSFTTDIAKSLSDGFEAAAAGGAFDFAKLGAAFNNPLGAASLGAFGGGILAQLGGGNAANGAIGGAIGAGAGQLFGGPIGGLAGGLVGSLLGGFLGGSKNRANATVNFDTGGIRHDNSPGADDPNRQNVTQLANAALQLRDIIESFGATLSGSVKLRVSSSRDAVESQRIAVRQIIPQISANDNRTLATILENTIATTFDDLAQDLAFAEVFDSLVDGAGQFKQAARELERQFQEASREVNRLGLDESKLVQARSRANEQLLAQAEDTLFGAASSIKSFFDSQLEPLQSAIQDITSGAGSGLSIENQLALQKQLFEEEFARVRSGATTDTSRLADLGGATVDLARQFTGGAGDFRSVADDIATKLQQVVGDVQARQATAEERIGATLTELTDEAVRNRRVLDNQLEELKRLRLELADVRVQLERAA